jgi:hypothetical protein
MVDDEEVRSIEIDKRGLPHHRGLPHRRKINMPTPSSGLILLASLRIFLPHLLPNKTVFKIRQKLQNRSDRETITPL